MSDFVTLRIANLASLPDALIEAAEVTVGRVLRLQADARKAWDYIRVEIWEDSGRLIIFPALSSSKRRVDVSGVQIICAELAQRVDALGKSGLGDDIYTREIEKEVAALASTVRDVLPHHLSHPVRIFDSFDQAQ